MDRNGPKSQIDYQIGRANTFLLKKDSRFKVSEHTVSVELYDAIHDSSLLNGNPRSAVLARIRKQIIGPFWQVSYLRKKRDERPIIGGAKYVFIDQESGEILGRFSVL